MPLSPLQQPSSNTAACLYNSLSVPLHSSMAAQPVHPKEGQYTVPKTRNQHKERAFSPCQWLDLAAFDSVSVCSWQSVPRPAWPQGAQRAVLGW